jgi:hypothetical protein
LRYVAEGRASTQLHALRAAASAVSAKAESYGRKLRAAIAATAARSALAQLPFHGSLPVPIT